MSVPLRLLTGSSRRLLLAVLLFIVLDLSVLVINLWIAHRVENDAVSINLAGRQRMLSQRITKAAIMATDVLPRPLQENDYQELLASYQLFDSTLRAFNSGGSVVGSNGELVFLHPVLNPQGQILIDQTLSVLAPLAQTLGGLSRTDTPAPPQLVLIRDYMVEHNEEILSLMNTLTTVLEKDSVSRISELRFVQVGAFLLAIANFLVIVVGMLRQYHSVEQERRHWHSTAQRDALTGLFNRRALEMQLSDALAHAESNKGALTLLIVDLDNFKPINDTHGHSVGDEVLQTFAKVLSGVTRQTDTVARLGGDEFAVICPGMNDERVISHFCQRFFSGLEKSEISLHKIKVRASVGAAVYPMAGTDAQTLFNAADSAMYVSKQRGGQCYVMAQQ